MDFSETACIVIYDIKVPGHITMSIFGKKASKTFFFWNQEADDLETWYTA